MSFKKITYVVSSMVAISVLMAFILGCIKFEVFSQGSTGVKAVMAMYDFKDVEDLESNLEDLEKITTQKVYEYLAVTNTDKSLNTYLKFKQEPVEVEILESRPGTIIYTLHSNSLSDGRKFLFTYDLNYLGKIKYAREMECIDFY